MCSMEDEWRSSCLLDYEIPRFTGEKKTPSFTPSSDNFQFLNKS